MVRSDNKNARASERAFVYYVAAQATTLGVATAQAVLVMPMMLRTEGAERYGVWLAAAEWLIWVQFMDLGLSNVVVQRVAVEGRHRNQDDANRAFHSTWAIVLIAASIGALVVSGLLRFGLEALSHERVELANIRSLMSWSVAAALVLAATNPIMALARGLERTVPISIWTAGGSVVGLLSTWLLAERGAGFVSLAVGMWVRAGIVFVGSVASYVTFRRCLGWTGVLWSADEVKRALGVSPATTLGSIGYLAGNQGQITIVSAVISPLLAAQYVFTRKLFDLLRAVFDAVAAGALGFASAEAATALDGQARSNRTLTLTRQSALGFSVLSCITALASARLVGWWVGPELFIGMKASLLFAASASTIGVAYISANLLRASGGHRSAGALIFVEGVLRLLLTLSAALAHSLPLVAGAGFLSGAVLLFGVDAELKKHATSGALRVPAVELLGRAALLPFVLLLLLSFTGRLL